MERRILVFAGSVRSDSHHRKLARVAAEKLAKSGADVTLLDLRDYPMPIYDGDLEANSGLPVNAKAFKEILRSHEAFVIASPEYNGSFTALLKNAIDWASRPESGEGPLAVFRGKTAAIMGASPGPGGGRRGLRHLRELLQMIGVKVLEAEVIIPKATAAFDARGNLVRPDDIAALDRLVNDLLEAMEPSQALVA